MQSVINSTCCSIAIGTFVKTEGLPGPVIVKKLGKPGICKPRNVKGPFFHKSLRLSFFYQQYLSPVKLPLLHHIQ